MIVYRRIALLHLDPQAAPADIATLERLALDGDAPAVLLQLMALVPEFRSPTLVAPSHLEAPVKRTG